MKNILIAITMMLVAPLISCDRLTADVVNTTVSSATQSDNGAFTIAAGDRALGYLEFSMNSQGNALLAWRDLDDTVRALYYQPDRYRPWSDIAQVSTNTGISHKATVAENGDCFLVWADGANVLGQNRYDAQVGWGMASGIPKAGSGWVSDPVIATGPSGSTFALWKEYTATEDRLVVSRYESGAGWSSAETLQALTGSGFDSYTIAADASGNALVVWSQYIDYSGIFTVLTRRYQAGVGWGQVEIINSDDNPYPFHVAFDSAGNALVVWNDIYYAADGNGYRRIVSRRYSSTTGWEALETLLELPVDTSFIIEVQMAMNPAGDAVLVWMQNDTSGSKIWSDRYVAGNGWTKAPVRISEVGDDQDPQVAIDPAGNAVAVWRTVFDSWDIWGTKYSPENGWSTARMISANHDNTDIYADRPFVGMDSQGNILAVWEQHDSLNGIVSFWGNRLTDN